jgi:thioredoxin 2
MPTTAADSATQQITIRCGACATWNRIDARRAAHGPKCGSCRAPLALDRPLLLNDETFDRVISGTDLPVLVDFYANWCGPCKMMAPAVDALAREMVGRALVAKVDTEASRVGTRFQVRGIPTSIVFRGGKEATRQVGAVPLEVLRRMITDA